MPANVIDRTSTLETWWEKKQAKKSFHAITYKIVTRKSSKIIFQPLMDILSRIFCNGNFVFVQPQEHKSVLRNSKYQNIFLCWSRNKKLFNKIFPNILLLSKESSIKYLDHNVENWHFGLSFNNQISSKWEQKINRCFFALPFWISMYVYPIYSNLSLSFLTQRTN